jgi:hypothetical protein
MRIPESDVARVSSGEQRSAGLGPVHDQASAPGQAHALWHDTERTNHLHFSLFERRIVVAIESNNAVS